MVSMPLPIPCNFVRTTLLQESNHQVFLEGGCVDAGIRSLLCPFDAGKQREMQQTVKQIGDLSTQKGLLRNANLCI